MANQHRALLIGNVKGALETPMRFSSGSRSSCSMTELRITSVITRRRESSTGANFLRTDSTRVVSKQSIRNPLLLVVRSRAAIAKLNVPSDRNTAPLASSIFSSSKTFE